MAEGVSTIPPPPPRLQVGSVEFVVPDCADPGRVLKWMQERYRALPSFEMMLTRKGRQRRVRVVYRT